MEFIGKEGFVWWKGVCENRKDPLKLGRYKIRIFGWHTADKQEMPTESLPWAHPSLPIDNGRNVVGMKEGDFCWGFFRDGSEAQEPIVVGYIPGIPEKEADPNSGFYDPTPDDELTPDLQPRPPEYSPVQEAAQDGEQTEDLSKYKNPDVLPGENIAFGELLSDYDPQNYKWDVNNDGTYNAVDAKIIIGTEDNIAGLDPGEVEGPEQIVLEMSRYPLADQLKEPVSSRLARNENIEKTIVAKKKGDLATAESASHVGMGVGSDEAYETEPFDEPETPYDAEYPFNHVYESESGHVIEIDDTPGKERLHHYHRSGTFCEVHPDGTRVVKSVKKGYNIFVEDFYLATGTTATMSAKEDFLIKAGSVMNLEAGSDVNVDSGSNTNLSVGADLNVKVGKDGNIVVEGDCKLLVKGNVYLAVEKDMHAAITGDFLLDAKQNVRITAGEKLHLQGKSISVIAQQTLDTIATMTTINGPASGPEMTVAAALVSGIITGGVPAPVPTIPAPVPDPNEAEEKSDEMQTTSPPKEGFILYGTSGDLYKPESDTTGKLVTLSPTVGTPHVLYEALPTGELQEVEIQYKHKDGSITTWNVIRPVHKLGAFIERGVYAGNGNGGRDHYRFAKSGKEYPKQMFLAIGETKYLILDSGVRHESFGGTYKGY